ncbi:MAG: ATP-binding protein [Candidatus Altiarchaeota archaeon]
MDSVGLVVASEGSNVDILVQSEAVELGSILNVGGHYGIVAGMLYDEDMKVGSRHRLIAKVQIFGRLHESRLHKVKKPVKPNERAVLAGADELERILSTDEPISIGTVYGTKARAYLKASEYDRHTAILASTGAGKSYTAANLVKEYARLSLPVVVVDTHGEYVKLLGKLAEDGSFKTKVYTVKFERKGFEKLIIPLSDLEARDFHHFIGLSEPQESALAIVLEKVAGIEYTIDDMIAECRKLDLTVIHEATQQALTRKLMKLKGLSKGVFDKYGTDINNLVETGQVTIIDASMAGEGIRKSVISYLSKELLQGRINKLNELGERKLEYPLLFVVEEAHNYAGANLVHSCKSQLQRIASEGRKFGIGLVVISQKPSKIDEEILSQCNSGIYMHITNPKDKEHIKKSFESISEEMIRGLDSLDVGECIIAGAILDIPFLMCRVDEIKVNREKASKFNFKKPVKAKTGGFNYV